MPEQLGRRDFLKGAAAVSGAVLTGCSENVSPVIPEGLDEDSIGRLSEGLDETEFSGGNELYLGNVNRWSPQFKGEVYGDKVRELKNQGYSDREIVKHRDVEREGSDLPRLFDDEPLDVKIVHFDEGMGFDSELYFASVKSEFESLLGKEHSINFDFESVEPSSKDLDIFESNGLWESVQDHIFPGLYLDGDRLKEKAEAYSDADEFMLLVEDDYLDGADGVHTMPYDVSIAEVTGDWVRDIYVIGHELGHSVGFPHNFSRDSLMSCNPNHNISANFRDRTMLMWDRIENSDLVINDSSEDSIEYSLELDDLSEGPVEEEFIDHLSTYLSDHYEVNMAYWEPKVWEEAEQSGENMDYIEFNHVSDDYKMELLVDEDIEDFQVYRSGSWRDN